MIDPDLIDPIAKEGLKLLSQSGLFKKQVARDQERLLSGDADEEAEEVALAIKRLRRRAVMFESLHELGESFTKESEQ